MTDIESKTNHLPAEKMSGGVRIARKDKRHASESDKAITSGEEEFIDDSSKAVTRSEIVQERQKAYPEKAVRSFHDKPIPTRQPHNNLGYVKANQPNHSVFQPQRFTN